MVVNATRQRFANEPQQQGEVELDQVQRQRGQPWSHRWNWVLDRPGRTGVGMRSLVAVALVFNAVLSVLRLSPVWGPQHEAFGLVINALGVVLLPVGLLFAWSALRLYTFRSLPSDEGTQT